MVWGKLEVSYQLSVAYRPTTIPTDIEVDHIGMLVFPSELAREAEGLSCGASATGSTSASQRARVEGAAVCWFGYKYPRSSLVGVTPGRASQVPAAGARAQVPYEKWASKKDFFFKKSKIEGGAEERKKMPLELRETVELACGTGKARSELSVQDTQVRYGAR